MIRFLARGLLFSLMALLLASCDSGNDTVKVPGVSGYRLTITTFDSITSLAATQTSAAAPLRVDVLVEAPTAAGGWATVTGGTVRFTTTVGELGTSSAQTNLAGVASVVLNAGSGGVRAGTLSAQFTDPSGNIRTGSVTLTTAGDDSSSSGTGGTGATNVLRLTLDARDGGGSVISATNPITTLNPGRLVVLATLDGVPVPNALITFTAPAVVSMPVNSVATNASGTAETTLTPITTGAGTATAALEFGGKTITASVVISSSVTATAPAALKLGRYDVTVPVTGFRESQLVSSATGPIDAGSTISITAEVGKVDTTTGAVVPYTTPVAVRFTSDCASLATPTAVIDTQSTTNGGRAQVTYQPTGCRGTDTITATMTDGSSTRTATTTVTILDAPVGQVAFVSADPPTIALQGTGGLGRLTRSEVIFRVLGEDGSLIRNQFVCFKLSTTAGGLTVNPSATTSAGGEATATVQAGSVPTSVRVQATVDSDGDNNCATVPSPVKTAVSDALTVSTGLPDQNSISLSVSERNPEGAAGDIDGVIVTVTARAADHFNNPVPNGTAISFWSELGSIQPSCTTINGACSVTWISQLPRDNRDSRAAGVIGTNINLGRAVKDRAGRSTIYAYAVGEESFTDSNGNGRYDLGEPFGDLGEVIKDSNENGVRDEPNLPIDQFENEEFVDFDGEFDFDVPNGIYDGVLCGPATTPANCSGDATVNVRARGLIVMSSGEWMKIYVTPTGAVNINTVTFDDAGNLQGVPAFPGFAGAGSVDIIVTDGNGNAPPAGTTVSATTDAAATGSIATPNSFTVGSRTEPDVYTFTLKAPTGLPADGKVVLTVKSGDTTHLVYIDVDW